MNLFGKIACSIALAVVGGFILIKAAKTKSGIVITI